MLTYLPTMPDPHAPRQRLDAADQRLPLGDVDLVRRLVDAERAADVGVEALLVQDERDLVDVGRVDRRDHGVDGDVAQQRDLALQGLRNRLVAPADDDVGLDTAAAQLGHRVLGRLRLLLPRRRRIRHQREVHVADVVAADVPAELADRLDEGHDLDVADRAADLDDDDVDVLVGQAPDALLDLVGDVRDDLDRLARGSRPAAPCRSPTSRSQPVVVLERLERFSSMKRS